MRALDVTRTHDIFSFHLAKLPFFKIPPFLWTTRRDPYGVGLLHAESFLAMNLGEPVLSSSRFDFQSVGFFAWWQHEAALDHFLSHPSQRFLYQGWHVRMRLYRRWGFISELKDACVDPTLYQAGQPVVAVTLARLKLLQASRFIRWGRPVEQQVRDHDRQTLALAGFRPLHTFSTLSIWKSERDIIRMVHGVDQEKDGTSHALAMQERERKDFHHEFTTMRFVPFHEEGTWKGQAGLSLTHS